LTDGAKEGTKLLPRKGFKCITVTEKVHRDIQKNAKENGYTMKEYVQQLLLRDMLSKEGK
jgi:hypothetical protein